MYGIVQSTQGEYLYVLICGLFTATSSKHTAPGLHEFQQLVLLSSSSFYGLQELKPLLKKFFISLLIVNDLSTKDIDQRKRKDNSLVR